MKKAPLKITAIIPAYNEEKNIYSVLESLNHSKFFNEIICVNDGSTDGTLSIIKKFNNNVFVVDLKKNHGKAYAVAKALYKAEGDIIVLVDADITGITDAHIKKLVYPLIRHSYHAVIGYPYHNKIDELLKSISGERAYFKKDLLPYLPNIKNKGYGLELYLNYQYRHRKVKFIRLFNLKHEQKYEKQPLDFAAKMFLIEWFDMLTESLKQNNDFAIHLIKSNLFTLLKKKPKMMNKKLLTILKRIKQVLLKEVDDFTSEIRQE